MKCVQDNNQSHLYMNYAELPASAEYEMPIQYYIVSFLSIGRIIIRCTSALTLHYWSVVWHTITHVLPPDMHYIYTYLYSVS